MPEIKRRKSSVILRKCNHYDVSLISGIIHETISDLKCSISGRIFIKPNVVTANRKYIHHSYTNPAVVEAMANVLKEYEYENITIGESGGFGTPTRMLFKESGYFRMAQRAGINLIDLNEHPVEKVKLNRGVRHRNIMLSKRLLEKLLKYKNSIYFFHKKLL